MKTFVLMFSLIFLKISGRSAALMDEVPSSVPWFLSQHLDFPLSVLFDQSCTFLYLFICLFIYSFINSSRNLCNYSN
jgi:hypothetical protein